MDISCLTGGVADSIPIMWFRRQGYKKDLVILTRPEGYQKKKMKFQGAINKTFIVTKSG